ncbi:MAG: polysaccharide biosynthesis/export family protein [Deltaproteobacteria bacterium]|nr:polysaccharide biosynthesis/export family protein [Deltaproteobacteria bacterium]
MRTQTRPGRRADTSGAGLRRVAGAGLLLAALLGLGGCYHVTRRPLPAAERSAASDPVPAPYRIQLGDYLNVRVYQHPELDAEVVVRPDGKISLPLIGELQAAGLEPATLSEHINEALRAELTTPRATVLLRDIGAKVYVGGEVDKPGVVPLRANLTLLQAISEAGSFTEKAHLKQVVLIRRDAAGHPHGWAVDARQVMGGIDAGQDVPLQASDIVYVPQSKIADVNQFVKQYIRDNLPIDFAIPIF